MPIRHLGDADSSFGQMLRRYVTDAIFPYMSGSEHSEGPNGPSFAAISLPISAPLSRLSRPPITHEDDLFPLLADITGSVKTM
jgi:hypothetical protein